jgi:hypothetical protein
VARFTRIFQEPGRDLLISMESTWYRRAEGDQRLCGKGEEEAYDPVVPRKVGNWP